MFEFGTFQLKSKLRKAPDNKTRSKVPVTKIAYFHGRYFPQNDPNTGKTENFQVLLQF